MSVLFISHIFMRHILEMRKIGEIEIQIKVIIISNFVNR